MTPKVTFRASTNNLGFDLLKKTTEAASISSFFLLVPHILKQALSETIPTLTTFNNAVVLTGIGTLAWPLYKTVYTPLAQGIYGSISRQSNNIASCAASFFSCKKSEVRKDSSFLDDSLKSICFLTTTGYLFNELDSTLNPSKNYPLYPLIASVALSSLGNSLLQKAINDSSSEINNFTKGLGISKETATTILTRITQTALILFSADLLMGNT